jgi:hypothetical protein
MLNRIYAGLGIAVLVIYGLASFGGWEFDNPERKVLPAGVRQSPGGYRSFHFWYSGYHGGK